jgi:tetratricopeptide (TPR) repeat protein
MEPMTTGANARPEDLQQLAVVFQSTARVQGLKRDMARGLESSLKLLALRRSLAERDRSNIAWRDALASAEAEVSMALHRMGNPREALPHARQALLVRELRAAEQPHNVEAQRGLILAYSHVADVLGNPTMASLGDVAGAIELYRKMTDIAERLAMADEADRRAKVDLANCLLRLGSALLAPPAADEGIVRLERSAALMRELAAAEPKDNRARSTLAFVYGRLGDARLASGRTAQALENYDQAIGVANGVLAADPAEFSVTPTLALALLGKGLTLAKAGHRDAAVREGSRGVEVLEHARIAQAANVRTATSAGAGHALMGRLYLSLGGPADLSQACSSFERSRQAYSQATRLDPQSAADLETVTRELARCRPARTR